MKNCSVSNVSLWHVIVIESFEKNTRSGFQTELKVYNVLKSKQIHLAEKHKINAKIIQGKTTRSVMKVKRIQVRRNRVKMTDCLSLRIETKPMLGSLIIIFIEQSNYKLFKLKTLDVNDTMA